MTVVIDCNIFVMCLTSHSPYHRIYQSLIAGRFNLNVTTDIILEYEEIIQRKYNVSTANTLVTLLSELPNVNIIHSNYRWRLIENDLDDNKYCDCAIAGQADFIVTEDKHFDVLKSITFPAIDTVNIEKFMELID
ncbi:putative toxin-antitoxin system toxin component, PIN family [Mucilaginibacter sp. L3T2-6]|uniref:putative toxin-antitoxin system toxin component, PIN family n=1 Tax=Mucilaginibacter sp. L3T2-6 TaxID=3062491 RepID=UPI0026766090|nr:putative toxin-antitoxin system toxin component, PIN family [Mucilaginibacter sp. L3T2-6]MDO3641692.1 putative toxin-antitoxin system toxin component, PIN family [Mucilaginibacter sp. L3T2-6]MDV6214186.1 putative toxin-antitoxin system toxin component, PIN family [Mucilaginibacter sp. L3T2-6]